MHTSFPNCICFLYNFRRPVLIKDNQSKEDGAREGDRGRERGKRAEGEKGMEEREGEEKK